MDDPLLSNFKTPSVKIFDGVGDPHKHVIAYQAMMMLLEANDAMMFQAFFSTIGGPTQRWFTRLPGESINFFYNLVVKFTSHFMQGKKARKHFSYIANVKQWSNKSLTEFLVWWIETLKARDLYKNLKRKTLISYVAMMAKVDLYAKEDEVNRAKKQKEEGFRGVNCPCPHREPDSPPHP